MTILTLLSAGCIGGCRFVWQNAPSKIVMVPGSVSNHVYSVREVLAQPAQEISINVASETQAALPPSTPIISPTTTPSPFPPTATPTSLPFTNTPSPTATAIPTNIPTLVPTPTPSFTPMPIPTESAILATPVVTTRPANSPTPIIMKYAAPVLVEPQDQFAYIKGNTPLLRWEPVGNLAPNEQYAVRIVYRFQNEVVYKGAQVKESEWTIPLSLFGQVDGSAYLYEWFVVVERLNDDGSATAISPESGRHLFTWK